MALLNLVVLRSSPNTGPTALGALTTCFFLSPLAALPLVFPHGVIVYIFCAVLFLFFGVFAFYFFQLPWLSFSAQPNGSFFLPVSPEMSRILFGGFVGLFPLQAPFLMVLHIVLFGLSLFHIFMRYCLVQECSFGPKVLF